MSANRHRRGTPERRDLRATDIADARGVRYNGDRHVCTDPLSLEPGVTLPDDAFPPVPR